MKSKLLISIICMILIVTTPLTIAVVSFSPSQVGPKEDVGEAIIINIADYEPKPIPQSALENQNVPVFIYLKGTTLGSMAQIFASETPTIDPLTGIDNIPPIRDIVVTPQGESSKYIVGIPKYIRPKNKAFSLNNLGTLVVTLKQTPEKDIPKTIDLNFTAKVYFDLEEASLFGISTQDYIVKPYPNEQDWLALPDPEKNPFFSGRAFLRLISVAGDTANFEFYDRSLSPIFVISPASIQGQTSITTKILAEGETSTPITIGESGNPYLDSFRIKLNKIIGPQDKAFIRISVNGKTYDKTVVVDSRIFTGSNWKVRSINAEEPNKILDHVTLRDKVKALLGYTIAKDVPLPVYEFSHKIVLADNNGNIIPLETSIITKDEAGKQGAFDDIYEKFSSERVVSLESQYCLDEAEYVCKSVSDFSRIIKDYPSSTVAANAYFNLAEIYDKKLIPDTGQENYNMDMINLARYYYSRSLEYENFEKRSEAEARLEQLTQGVRGSAFLADEGVYVELIRVQKLIDQDKGSVDIKSNIYDQSTKPIKHAFKEYLKDSRGLIIGKDDDEEFYWQITSINPQSVTIRKHYLDGRDGEERSLLVERDEIIPIVYERYVSGRYSALRETPLIKTQTIRVTNIDAKVEADVTILPGIGKAVSTSNFLIHLPIDQRPFQFSPEQIKDQIKKTDEMIKKLDKIITKLDKLVTNWKKTCIVVGTYLTIKNSFLTGSSRAEARKEMAPYYEQKCQSDIDLGKNRDKYRTLDGCFIYNKDEIEKSLDAGEEAVRKADEQYKKDREDKNLESNYNRFIKAGGTDDEYKTYKRYDYLNKTVKDPAILSYVNKNLDSIEYDAKLGQYDAAKKLAQEIVGEGKEVKPEDLQYALTAIRNAQSITPLKPKESEILSNIKSTDKLTPDKREIFSGVIVKKGEPKPQILDLVRATDYEAELIPTGSTSKLEETYLNQQLNIYSVPCEKDLAFRQAHINDWCLGDGKVNEAYIKNTYIPTLIKQKKLNPASDEKGRPIYLQVIGNKLDETSINSETKVYFSDLTEYAGQSVRNSYQEQDELGRTITAQYTKDGFAYCYPLGDLNLNIGESKVGAGDYALILERYQTTDIKTFSVWNVGANGKIECGRGDDIQKIHESTIDQNAKEKSRIISALSRAGATTQCKESNQFSGQINAGGVSLRVKCSFDQANTAEQNSQPQCIENMDPGDCQLLFNVCDPVMCPSSRCNLGGRWKVDDVIATGVIGSAVLCSPNYKEGVYVPVCLTGILAGLKNIKTILEGYKSCLQTSLAEGKNIGLCDYIRSIGLCEIMWKEALAILDVKGGIIDWALGKVSTSRGGGEYLAFSSAAERASKSFNYFTTTYSNTLLAQYKGKSKEEIGSEICKLAVAGKLPNFGDVLDELSQPEDPPQFVAVFDESPSVERAGVDQYGRPSQGRSLYRGFYHIYAGKQLKVVGLTEASKFLQYAVYLKNSRRPDIPITYVTKNTGAIVNYATIPRESYAQESINVYAETGYDQICVVIAGRAPSCGFGKTSSDFSVGVLQDNLVVDELSRNIKTEKECVPDAPKTSPSLSSLTMPQQFGVLNSGIVRVCNPVAPGPLDKWRPIGDCGNDKNNKYLGKCWIDMSSVSINDAEKYGIVAEQVEDRARKLLGAEDVGLVSIQDGKFAIGFLNTGRKQAMVDIIEKLKNIGFAKGKVPKKPKQETPIITPGEPAIGEIPNIPDRLDIQGGCRYDGVFEFEKTNILIGEENIKKIADALKSNGIFDVYVYGFASKEGTAKFNTNLANNRANRIKSLLQNEDLTVVSEGLGETTRFDETEKDQTNKKLAGKRISQNRRFVISTEQIDKFIPAPDAGSTANCEDIAQGITNIKEPTKSLKAGAPKETITHQASFDNYKYLNKITGYFEPDKYYYTIRVHLTGLEPSQVVYTNAYKSKNVNSIFDITTTEINLGSTSIKKDEILEITISLINKQNTAETIDMYSLKSPDFKFITGSIIAVRANGGHDHTPPPEGPTEDVKEPEIPEGAQWLIIDGEYYTYFKIVNGKLMFFEAAKDRSKDWAESSYENIEAAAIELKVETYKDLSNEKDITIKYKEDISQQEITLVENEDQILALLNKAEQDFKGLKTPLSGDSPITNYQFEREYTYEDLILNSIDSEISAQALLQRGEFYKLLAELKYEYLIAPKIAIQLEKQDITQLISKYKIIYLEPGVEILGDFDILNYYYIIDFELQEPTVVEEPVSKEITKEIPKEGVAPEKLEPTPKGEILTEENDYTAYFDENTRTLTITGDFSNDDAEITIDGPEGSVDIKKTGIYSDFFYDNKYAIVISDMPNDLGIENKEDIVGLSVYSGKFDSPELKYYNLPEEQQPTSIFLGQKDKYQANFIDEDGEERIQIYGPFTPTSANTKQRIRIKGPKTFEFIVDTAEKPDYFIPDRGIYKFERYVGDLDIRQQINIDYIVIEEYLRQTITQNMRLMNSYTLYRGETITARAITDITASVIEEENKLIYDSVTDKGNFEDRKNFKVGYARLEKFSIINIKISVFERTEETINDIDLNPNIKDKIESIRNLPSYASYNFQGPSVTKPKEEIKKFIEGADNCKEECGGGYLDIERCTLTACTAIEERYGINCDFTPGAISGSCEQKKVITKECSDCDKGVFKYCSEDYCKYIGEKIGKECEFSGITGLTGDCNEKVPEVSEEPKEVPKEIEEKPSVPGIKPEVAPATKVKQINEESYNGITYKSVAFDQGSVELKVLPYGDVFEDDITKHKEVSLKSFYNKLTEKGEQPTLIVNGGYFTKGAPKPLGLLITGGKIQSSIDEGGDTQYKNGVLIVRNNQIEILNRDKYKELYLNNNGITQGVQGHLLFDETGYFNTNYHDGDSRPRTTIGINCIDNSKIIFAQTYQGEKGQIGKYLRDKLNCKRGINLDGGSSTSIMTLTEEGVKSLRSDATIANVVAVYSKDGLAETTGMTISKPVNYYTWPGAWYTTYYRDYATSVGYKGLFAVQPYPLNNKGEIDIKSIQSNTNLYPKYPVEHKSQYEIFRLEIDGGCNLDLFKKAISNDVCCVAKDKNKYDTSYCVPYNNKITQINTANPCGSGLNVIMYHEVDAGNGCIIQKNDPRYCISESLLEQQFIFLKENCNVITANQLVSYINGRQKPKNTVVITFDDGSKSDYITALPLLEKYQLPAVFSITTGNIGKSGYMTLDDLKKLAQSSLVTIASHSKSHGAGNTYAKDSTNKVAREKEISESKEILENWLATTVPATKTETPTGESCEDCNSYTGRFWNKICDIELCKSISQSCNYEDKSILQPGGTCTSAEPKIIPQTGAGFSFVVLSDVHEGQEYNTDKLVETIKKFNPKYIVINGDLIMKGGSKCGKSMSDTTPNIECYNKFVDKFKSLGAQLMVLPGNHDRGDYDAVYKVDKKIIEDNGVALIGINYRKPESIESIDISKYSQVFVFSHYAFLGHKQYKSGFDTTKLSSNFINKLKTKNGQCALIAGDNHVYDVRTGHDSGCLAVQDGVAGGDHGCSSSWCRKDSKGVYQNYASYTLVEVYDKGFKICKISEENNFKFNEADCTYRNK